MLLDYWRIIEISSFDACSPQRSHWDCQDALEFRSWRLPFPQDIAWLSGIEWLVIVRKECVEMGREEKRHDFVDLLTVNIPCIARSHGWSLMPSPFTNAYSQKSSEKLRSFAERVLEHKACAGPSPAISQPTLPRDRVMTYLQVYVFLAEWSHTIPLGILFLYDQSLDFVSLEYLRNHIRSDIEELPEKWSFFSVSEKGLLFGQGLRI